MICGNEEYEFQQEGFSPVADFTASKLTFCLALQKGWMAKYLDSENSFRNGNLERPVYAELPNYMFSADGQNTEALRLKRSLCGLKEAASIRNVL